MNIQEIINGKIKPLPGSVEWIKSLAATGFKQAIVSSTPSENIELITETLGIKILFQHIISARDVTEGKPNPQGFLMSAKKLGVKPEFCVVMEDAVAGVTAAKRGGMYCIAITNTSPRERLSEADIVVDSLVEIKLKTIEELFNRIK